MTLSTLNYGNYGIYSFLRVMQDLDHQQYDTIGIIRNPQNSIGNYLGPTLGFIRLVYEGTNCDLYLDLT